LNTSLSLNHAHFTAKLISAINNYIAFFKPAAYPVRITIAILYPKLLLPAFG
jgi:hypothetical protein